MKRRWTLFAGGIEIRDDDQFTIYHNIGFAILRLPDGRLIKFRTVEGAKEYSETLTSLPAKSL